MQTQPFWYLVSTPILIVGVMCISVGLFAGCVLVLERRNPLNLTSLPVSRIFAGALSIIAIGVLFEVIAMRLAP